MWSIGSLVLLAVFSASACCAQGDENAGKLEARLRSAATCAAANQILQKDAWGSGADTGFAEIVIRRCESTFKDKLNATGTMNYADEQAMCLLRESRKDGTMHVSAASLCSAQVAADFAAHPLAHESVLVRASFDCAEASTPREKTICSDKSLGLADIVLSRSYAAALRISPQTRQKAAIRASQRAWLQHVDAQCKVTQKRATKEAAACMQERFIERFTRIDSCMEASEDGGIAACLNSGSSDR